MELTQLRYVLQLASTSNFSKAADRLYITQPALSQQINVLRRNLGLSYLGAPPARLLSRKLGRSLLRGAREVLVGWRNSSAPMALRPAGR